MSDINSKVKRAITAYKGGQRSEARKLLMEVVDADDKNEQGWLYLSLVVDSKQEQQLCLENVLAINPHNQQARKALEVLNKKLGVAPPPPPPAAASSKPAPSSSVIEEESTIHSWGDIDTSSTSTDAGWGDLSGSAPATPSPSSSATPAPSGGGGDGGGWFDDSSPWNTNADDPAVSGGYTYGRTGADAVGTEFSHNELDSWITDMGIGQSESGALNLADLQRPPVPTPPPAVPAAPSSGDLFGDFSQPLPPVAGVAGWDDEPAPSPVASTLGEGWDEFAIDAPAFNITPTKADPFTDTRSGLFEAPSGSSLRFGGSGLDAAPELDSKQIFPTPPASSLNYYEDEDEDDEGALSYLGEDRDVDDVDGLAGLDAVSIGYYRLIPDEIAAIKQKLPNARARSGPSVGVILLLVLLNLLALGGVAFNAMNFMS